MASMRRPSRPNPTARTTARPSRNPANQAAKAKDRAARIAARQAAKAKDRAARIADRQTAKAQDRDARIAARDKRNAAKTAATAARDKTAAKTASGRYSTIAKDKRNAAKTAATAARDKAAAPSVNVTEGPIADTGVRRTPPMQPRKPAPKPAAAIAAVGKPMGPLASPYQSGVRSLPTPEIIDDTGMARTPYAKPMQPVPQPQPTPAPSVNVAEGPIDDTGMFRMKKGGKVKAVKKSSSGGTAKVKKANKIRGYGMARGGKVCKIR